MRISLCHGTHISGLLINWCALMEFFGHVIKIRKFIRSQAVTNQIFPKRPGFWDTILILYFQEVVTLQKKYSIYLHQKMRFTPFINYYDRYFRLNNIRLQSKIILGRMNSIGWNSSIQYFRSGHYVQGIQ